MMNIPYLVFILICITIILIMLPIVVFNKGLKQWGAALVVVLALILVMKAALVLAGFPW